MTATDIAKQLQDLISGPLWLDENFRKKIDGLTEEEAFTKPLPEIHSVAELVSHLYVWIKACMDRMNGLENDLKDNDANDWKANDDLKKQGWHQLREDYYRQHEALVKLAQNSDEAFLGKKYQQSGFSYKDILHGLIHHDAYHLGQIGITIKLLRRPAG